MDSTPLYIIVGSILGYISGLILGILHLPQLFHMIGSGLVWLYRWLRARPMVFNQWRWWRQYRPSWKILNYEEVKIKIEDNEYHLELQVEIEYRNRNDRYEVEYEDGLLELDLYHKGRGWEGRPYHLLNRQGGMRRTLQPKAIEKIKYMFENSIKVKPLIEYDATCNIVGEVYGRIHKTPYIPLDGYLKREGSNKFKVSTVWESGANGAYTTE